MKKIYILAIRRNKKGRIRKILSFISPLNSKELILQMAMRMKRLDSVNIPQLVKRVVIVSFV